MDNKNTGEAYINEIHWIIVFSSEALLILVGNSITIIIFIKIQSHLRQTCYLLLSLTVADLLLGVAISLHIWDGILFWSRNHESRSLPLKYSGVTIDVLASTASVSSLALIALERMLAILWPFRHRTLETWHYLVSTGVIWMVAIINGMVVLALYSNNTISFATMGLFAISILSTVVIFASYLAIWINTRRNRMQNITNRSLAQNKRLAKTLCIVTLLSLITQLPSGVSFAAPTFLVDQRSLFTQITGVLQYANSFLNPIIYCLRMTHFKNAIKKLCRRPHFETTRPSSSSHHLPALATQKIAVAFKKTCDTVDINFTALSNKSTPLKGNQDYVCQ